MDQFTLRWTCITRSLHCTVLFCFTSDQWRGTHDTSCGPWRKQMASHSDGTMEESLIKKTFKILLGRARWNQDRMLQDIWVSNVRKPLPVTLIPQTTSRDPSCIAGAAGQGCFAGAVVWIEGHKPFTVTQLTGSRGYNYPDITLVLSSALLLVTPIGQTQWNPKNKGGTSLALQFPANAGKVQSLVWEDSTSHRATKPAL